MNFDPTWISVLIGIATLLLLAGFWLRRRYAGKIDNST
jgi:LPXTG-motif cell wall-anchored protein